MSAGWLESGRALAPEADDVQAAAAAVLAGGGVVRVPGRWPDRAAAWHAAVRITGHAATFDPLCAGLGGLEVVGEFTVPPPDVVQRDFQALHIDFGVPKLAGQPVAVARFTALYLDGQLAGSGAATRIVPLGSLLGQRRWPARAVLAERLCGGASERGAVEGILARIIEAADQSHDLPDPEGDTGFLCGMEFAALDEELRYFAAHGLDLAAAEDEVVLSAGELLLFDNLAVAHGRRGRRHAGELHQLCTGFAALGLAGQAMLLDWILASFEQRQDGQEGAGAECGP